jgi:hypothetical protein
VLPVLGERLGCSLLASGDSDARQGGYNGSIPVLTHESRIPSLDVALLSQTLRISSQRNPQCSSLDCDLGEAHSVSRTQLVDTARYSAPAGDVSAPTTDGIAVWLRTRRMFHLRRNGLTVDCRPVDIPFVTARSASCRLRIWTTDPRRATILGKFSRAKPNNASHCRCGCVDIEGLKRNAPPTVLSGVLATTYG